MLLNLHRQYIPQILRGKSSQKVRWVIAKNCEFRAYAHRPKAPQRRLLGAQRLEVGNQ